HGVSVPWSADWLRRSDSRNSAKARRTASGCCAKTTCRQRSYSLVTCSGYKKVREELNARLIGWNG
ncbi:hypothetical protein ACQKP7_30660, partial [Pseudomonas frederiksbergensis]|uniref:hypothetical protein n=1 Tax=Pseudomonas frederiksbergensis TaxID=104087 RepID=UPI003D009BCF